MSRAKQQQKKQAIRKAQTERKTGSADGKATETWRGHYEQAHIHLQAVRAEAAATRKELHEMTVFARTEQKRADHNEKVRRDQENSVYAARESLVQIRKMHFDNRGNCNECGKKWPCPTLKAVKDPAELVILSLLGFERELGDVAL